MSVKLGVPSKGRLMEQTFDWFAAHGVRLHRTGSEREYSGAVEGADGVELVLLSAGASIWALRDRTSCARSWPIGKRRWPIWHRWALAMPI